MSKVHQCRRKDISKMEYRSESPSTVLQKTPSMPVRILRTLYGIVCWLALANQIESSVSTWNNTVTYDYFCGNPLMGYWAKWFVTSLLLGVVILPGGVWSLRHYKERTGILFLISFLFYILSLIIMIIIGIVHGTVPDFINFIDYAFG